MKTLIFTDSHGRDPSKLIDWAVKAEGIEKLVSLGDLATPGVLRTFLQKAAQYNLEYRLAIGNHDYHYVVKHWGTGSRGEESASDAITDWELALPERKFILEAVEGKNTNAGLIVPDKEIVYAHASLHDVPNEDFPEITDIVWCYLPKSVDKINKNFEEMARRGDFRLFFRGHDHKSLLFIQEGNFTRDEFGSLGKHKIDIENARTIVTVGAFLDGEFALYDSEKQEVDFKSWNFEENKPNE